MPTHMLEAILVITTTILAILGLIAVVIGVRALERLGRILKEADPGAHYTPRERVDYVKGTLRAVWKGARGQASRIAMESREARQAEYDRISDSRVSAADVGLRLERERRHARRMGGGMKAED